MSDRTNQQENSKRLYETRDVSLRGVVTFVVALFVSLIAVLWLSRSVLHYFVRVQPLGPPPTPFETVRALPPSPRLQVDPRQDLQRYLTKERATLNGYGWVDRGACVVRIPVDRAMDFLLQKGLPVRSSEAAQSPRGLEAGRVQQYTVPKGYAPQE